jgi:hypothetical protein
LVVSHNTQAETTEYLQYKSRAIAHEDLTRAKLAYSQRDKMTVPVAPNLSDGTGAYQKEKHKQKAVENFCLMDKDGNGTCGCAGNHPQGIGGAGGVIPALPGEKGSF